MISERFFFWKELSHKVFLFFAALVALVRYGCADLHGLQRWGDSCHRGHHRKGGNKRARGREELADQSQLRKLITGSPLNEPLVCS